MIKRLFEKDSALKIVSVFVAILVWIYVIYTVNPKTEITIDDVPVSYKIADIADNLSVVDHGVKFVDVKISGKRSDVIKIDKDDISAVLKLSSISYSGEYDNIKIDVTTGNKTIDIIEVSEEKTSVKVDNIISKQFSVLVDYENEMPKGYVISDKPSLSLEKVRVKGAKTYMDDVKGAYIKINCKNLFESKSIENNIYLKDLSGKVIDKNHKAYKNLEIEDESISAYVSVGETSMAKIMVSGLDEGKSATCSPSDVEIYCKDGHVDKIYTESIKGKKADDEGNIVLKLKIPNGVTVINGETSVKVKINEN